MFQVSWEKFVKIFVDNEGYKNVLLGLENTAYIALFGFLIGLCIGTVIAVLKVAGSNNKVAKAISKVGDVYVGFFRGTPILVQLLLVYYVLFPAMGVTVDKLIIAIVTFGMNSGAYVAEIMRSGVLSVDSGQYEAGRSLGLSYASTMCRIVLPQALKNSLPSLGNELIALVKDTSVAGFIAVFDLTGAFTLIGGAAYSYVVPYIVLALFYLVIVIILTLIIKLIERRLRKGDRRVSAK